MKKTTYIRPEMEVLILKENLLDNMPIDSQVYDDDEILGKESIYEETDEDDWFQHKNLWEE